MSSFKVEISGELKGRLTKVTNELKSQVQNEMNKFGLNTMNDAKKFAPTDESHLKQSITFVSKAFEVDIVVAANYAAYIEFGTRKFGAKYVASLPPEWKNFAAQFKGKGGGTMDEFIQRIMAWVQRKGIGGIKTKSGNTSGSKDSLDQMQQAAYAIALNILQNGVKPHPFLYPAVTKNQKILSDNLKKLV